MSTFAYAASTAAAKMSLPPITGPHCFGAMYVSLVITIPLIAPGISAAVCTPPPSIGWLDPETEQLRVARRDGTQPLEQAGRVPAVEAGNLDHLGILHPCLALKLAQVGCDAVGGELVVGQELRVGERLGDRDVGSAREREQLRGAVAGVPCGAEQVEPAVWIGDCDLPSALGVRRQELDELVDVADIRARTCQAASASASPATGAACASPQRARSRRRRARPE